MTFYSDLSKNTGLKKSILECFKHNSEEVKSAASYALGNISLGNLKEYLPFVLNEIEMQPKRQYLLLHSLKEVKQGQLYSGDPNSGIQWSILPRTGHLIPGPFESRAYLSGYQMVLT
jgi:hypothetical protein